VDRMAAMQDDDELVRAMKQLVPEYRSHNSVYSNFDPPTTKA